MAPTKVPEDLKAIIEANIDRVLTEAGRPLHGTTLERIGDIVMMTLKKHGVHDDGEDYTWWEIPLQ